MDTLPEKKTRSAEDLWAGLSFATLLILALLFGYVLTLSPAPGSYGIPHPNFQTMLRGGSGEARHGDILWLAWAIGAAEILFFGAMMALGARRGPSLGGTGAKARGSLRGLGWPICLGLAAHLAVWSALMRSYAGYLTDPDPELVLALPAPTAWMLYVLWGVPLIFAILYVVGFRRWIFSPDDEAAFNALVRRRREAEGNGQGGES